MNVKLRPAFGFAGYQFSVLVSLVLTSSICLTIPALAGCGDGRPKTYKTTGKVLVRGAPALAAQVTLYPVGETKLVAVLPKATVAADGGFALSTFKPGDGAPAGNYKVTVRWQLPPGATEIPKDPEKLLESPDRLQGKYSTPEQTPLTATVTAGENSLPPFELQ